MPAELQFGRASHVRPEVLDTSVLVPFFSRHQHRGEVRSAVSGARAWLSSLVALELYMGTKDRAEKALLDQFVRSFEQRGRILAPTHEDHVLAGALLNRRRRLLGTFEARHHVVDVLIAVSASRIGATVVTANLDHMEGWAAMARRTGRDVRVRAPQG